MNSLGISTDPSLLNVELPGTLVESPSVSTFLPEEEASICPLLPSTNGASTPLTFSHPLTPSVDNDSNASTNLVDNEDAKVETSSSTGSSSGIGMDAPDTSATALFNKHNYHHLQTTNGIMQDHNGHGPNGNINLKNDTPSFVSWNWPLIRKCTFFVFMSSLLAMCSIVVALIVTLPKTCNPRTAWFRGSVFYEIFPASFQDSNYDGVGDLRGISARVDYLAELGIAAVRLNSIFHSPHYPEDFENVTSLLNISPILGEKADLYQLAETLHKRNISLILDLPVGLFMRELQNLQDVDAASSSSYITSNNTGSATLKLDIADNMINKAIRQWTTLGVDGFYIKGLEAYAESIDIVELLATWKRLIGSDNVIIISELVLEMLEKSKIQAALLHIDLVDVHLNIMKGTKYLKDRIQNLLHGYLSPTDNGVWIHWSIGGVEKERITSSSSSNSYNTSLAATIMQLMLPGTPSLFYGDEIALETVHDPQNEHNDTKHLHHLPIMHWLNSTHFFTNRASLPWLPQTANFNFDNLKIITQMVHLRNRSPSIYKNSICKSETTLPNTQIRHSLDDILIVERIYPRRNSFVSISNFGPRQVSIDMTSMYYSGMSMLGSTRNERIYFENVKIKSLETIVAKLDK